ncbi:MAG: CHAT domain-containing protein [Bacteroidota bacterium]
MSLRLSAQPYVELQQQAYELANQQQFAASLDLAYRLYEMYPDDINAYILLSFNLINLNRLEEARPYVEAGLLIDPGNYSIYIDAGYYLATRGDLKNAKIYLTESLKRYPPGLDIKLVLDEMRSVGRQVQRENDFNTLAQWYQSAFQSPPAAYPSLATLYSQVSASASATNLVQSINQHADEYTRLQWYEMGVATYAQSTQWLLNLGLASEARQTAENGYQYLARWGNGQNAFQSAHLLYQLMQVYTRLGNDEKALQYLSELRSISKQAPVSVFEILGLSTAAGCYDRLGQNDDARQAATEAYLMAEKQNYRFGMASAANMLCYTYNANRFTQDVALSIEYGEHALNLARKYHFDFLLDAIVSNLGLAFWKTKTREGQEKCVLIYRELSMQQKKEKRYLAAATTLNNIASMFYAAHDYGYAAKLFEEAAAFSEHERAQVAAADRLTFFQSQVSAYQFMIACYAHLKQTAKAFEAMESSRSRVMIERLAKGKKIERVSLKEFQEMLQPGEACLMYSLFSAQEVSILLITSQTAEVFWHEDAGFISTIKKKYLIRLQKEHEARSGFNSQELPNSDTEVNMTDFHKVTQLTRRFFEAPGLADDVLHEYLSGYYRFLIQPVAKQLTGIQRLLIAPDNVLSFIPFEALVMPDGKYMVEKMSVRYMHSAGILKQISQRSYSRNRKSMLAMGGAVFQPMLNSPSSVRSNEDLNLLQMEVAANAELGKSQRKAYVSLFGQGALNSLPGTLMEVQGLSKTFTDATVITGNAMTENHLKELSQTGTLKQFKVVHLATHGFAVEEIPELSGIAMSIFTNEQGGEDGFINARELASLNMQADLAVLSACQTALGKIYDGEGVTGLTQSLIVAGANAAVVTLWPVSDQGTMTLMSGMYKQAASGTSYQLAITNMKRRFIAGEFGEQLRHPNYWAPFVYYGQ